MKLWNALQEHYKTFILKLLPLFVIFLSLLKKLRCFYNVIFLLIIFQELKTFIYRHLKLVRHDDN